MKYRIAKKIIKRTPSINLWLKSGSILVKAAGTLMEQGDNDSVGICIKFMDYDWKKCLTNANKIGITARYLRAYYSETYASKYFYNQYYKRK